jgi:hypothetical protein
MEKVSEGRTTSEIITGRSPIFLIGLGTLRLVGALLIVGTLFRVFAFLILAMKSPLVMLFAPLVDLCCWLLVFPLGIALYFLGAGQHRMPREQTVLVLLYQSLLPFACSMLVSIPLLIKVSLDPAWRRLSPQLQQTEALSVMTAIGLCLVAGVGMFLLHRLIATSLADYRLSVHDYFGSQPVSAKRRRSVRRRRVKTR